MRAQSERRSPLAAAFMMAGLLALCCGFALPAYAIFPHREPTARKEIEGLESQWRQALLTGDVAEVDRLVADDYLGISPNGTLETKADVLAQLRRGQFKISRLDLSDSKVRIYGATAVVTCKADLAATRSGRDVSGRFRYTRVYARRLGQWKVVSFEASRMRPRGERRAEEKPAPPPAPSVP